MLNGCGSLKMYRKAVAASGTGPGLSSIFLAPILHQIWLPTLAPNWSVTNRLNVSPGNLGASAMLWSKVPVVTFGEEVNVRSRGKAALGESWRTYSIRVGKAAFMTDANVKLRKVVTVSFGTGERSADLL